MQALASVRTHCSKQILNQLPADYLHAFRPKCICVAQLRTLRHELLSKIHHKMQTGNIILDFTKASDKVPNKKLLHKLDNYGIYTCSTSTKWTSSFLKNKIQQVTADGWMSVVSWIHQLGSEVSFY